MFSFKKTSVTLLFLLLIHNTSEFRFMRRIQGIGKPYYKILLALGNCREKLIYFDQKIWSKLFLNRVLDIYFKADNEHFKISRVEITLVINNTSSFAYSEAGVGYSEFSATLYLPTQLNFIIYAISIFSCSPVPSTDSSEFSGIQKLKAPISYMPFLRDSDKGN